MGNIKPLGQRRLDPPAPPPARPGADAEELFLRAVLDILDVGLIQVARNMIFHRLAERFGARR